MPKRVVVTGVGAVTPVGNDAPSTWTSLVAGRSGIARISLFDPSPLSVQIAGEVKGFDPLNYVDAKDARRMDRNVQFATAAAYEAVRDSGLVIDASNRDDVGVIIGSAIGGIRTLVEQQRVLDEKGPNRISPHGIQNLLPDTASGQVAIYTGARGHNMAVVAACATGGHAIGEAAEVIRRGDARAVIAGGTESTIVPLVVAAFAIMRVLAEGNDDPARACRPFDRTRQGFVISEGCSMMVLEDLDHARARGAKIYAEMASYAATSDAFHLAAPVENGEGAARAIAVALRKANLRPEDVDYINAHGTGTQLNDKYETTAIKTVFGEHAHRLAVSSTKSMTGHAMGAAGAIEALACVLSVANGIIPPTINLRHPDPECDLDYVPNEARHADVGAAISNSIGLGGHNSCVAFRKYEG